MLAGGGYRGMEIYTTLMQIDPRSNEEGWKESTN